jgi:hypothetical protein
MRALWFCLLLLSPAIANSQNAVKVSCRFLCMDGTTPPEKLIILADKDAEISCEIPEDRLSPAMVCDVKGNSIRFLSPKDRKPAATATIPPNTKAAILVFVDGAKTPDALPWRVYVIEDSDKNFPDGGAFVANFYNQDIRFVVGENKIMLRPAGSHGFGLPKQRDDFNMAPVVFEFQQEKNWITASESLLRFLPGMRYLIFAYVDAPSGRPRISTFQDVKAFTPPRAP